MDLQSFKASMDTNAPPQETSVHLQALWYAAKGDWEKAHVMIQDLPDESAAWVHAYLHRQEGDTWNADYWYRKAGKKRPSTSFEEEWDQITEELIKK